MHRIVMGGAGRRPTVIILHGLFGSGRNWQGVGRELLSRLPSAGLYLPDLRNHGRSVCFAPPPPQAAGRRFAPVAQPMTWEDLTGDVEEMLDEAAGARHGDASEIILVGHSFGGQIAMKALLERRGVAERVAKAVIVDIAPMAYAWEAGRPPATYIAAMQEIDEARYTDRRRAAEHLLRVEADEAIVNFLLTNYKLPSAAAALAQAPPSPPPSAQAGEAFAFAIPHQAIAAQMEALNGSFDGRGAAAATPACPTPTLFVVGGRSTYVARHDGRALEAIRRHFGQATVVSMQDCGHWPHHEDPGTFASIVADFITGRG